MNQATESPSQPASGVKLSVVVRTVGGGRHLRRCLDQLLPQLSSDVEALVPYDPTLPDIDSIRTNPRYASIRFVNMGDVVAEARGGQQNITAHELYDRRTTAGMLASRGEIIGQVEDYGAPAGDWVEQVLAAHRLPHGVIGGSVEHAGQGAWNWAVFLLDFGRFQKPLAEGPSAYLTDVNVSYKRAALESVRSLWERRYNEVTVHWALSRRNVVLWQRPAIEVWQDRGQLRMRRLLMERYCWGRLFGSVRARENSGWNRLLFALGSPAIPWVLVARISRKVLRGRRHVGALLRCFPHLVLLATVWCCGEFVGNLTGSESAR